MNADPTPTETHEDRARALRAYRADQDVAIRTLRLRVAGEALEKCGLLACVEGLHRPEPDFTRAIDYARAAVQHLRANLRDGHDEARYAATGAALEALGRLWSCS